MPFNSTGSGVAHLFNVRQGFQLAQFGSSVREENGAGLFSSRANFSSASMYRSTSRTSSGSQSTATQTTEGEPEQQTDSAEISSLAKRRQKLQDVLQALKDGTLNTTDESTTETGQTDQTSQTSSFMEQCERFVAQIASKSATRNQSSLSLNTTFIVTSSIDRGLLTSSQTEDYNRYEQTLDDLQAIDPDLYEKALGILATVGATDREKMLEGLANMEEFVQTVNNTKDHVATSLLSDIEGAERINKAFADFDDALDLLSAEGQSAAGSATAPDQTSNSVDGVIVADNPEQTNTLSTSTSLQQTSFNFRFALEVSGEISLTNRLDQVVLNMAVGQQTFCDPLVLDLGGNGIDLKSVEDGVEFDIDGDGEMENTGFIQGDDALLYLDKNGNGTADNGNELFGDQNGASNGFAELAKYDQNQDGKIDKLDEIYSQLKVWQDLNGDGINQLLESQSLSEAGVEAIFLNYLDSMQDDGNGNIIAQTGSFLRSDGSTGQAVDALFQTT